MTLYTSPEVCRMTGTSFRQLDYWCREHAVWPTVEADGSGTRRAWSDDDVCRIKFLKKGMAAFEGSLPVHVVAKVWRFLIEEGMPDHWLLIGKDDGEWAITVDDALARSGLLFVP